MMRALTTLCLVIAAAAVQAQPPSFDQLRENYDALHVQLLDNPGEKAEVSNFVYQKDVATYTFERGTFYLQRFVNNRPTTAVFVGKGSVTIDVPVACERQFLSAITKDSTIQQNFESMIIRMGDDFDLRLKEKFAFTPETFNWRALAKSIQGEIFFKPIIYHENDNYFRLLMSLYQRGPDGFFWCDFNRYTFTFDPGWPEQVQIGYEYQGGDQVVTTVASFQRRELGRYDDSVLSDLSYPTTAIARDGEIELSGTDGRRIDRARATLDVVVNADSLRFTWFNLQFNLNVDSVLADGARLEFFRRKTFDYTGIVLPRYYYRGDTLKLNVFYHGTNFDHFLPYLSNPAPCPTNPAFIVPSGYNYFTAGKGETTRIDGGKMRFASEFPAPLGHLYFHCYPSGISDTVEVVSDIGLTLNYVIADRNARNQSCFIPHPDYRKAITDAFNFISSRYGQPPLTFAEYVIPEGFQSAPGMIKVPQVACITDASWEPVGGLDISAGESVARQWAGAMMRPQSSREDWLVYALPVFLGLQYIESHRSGDTYFANLLTRRDSLYLRQDVGQDVPLAAGYRVNSFRDENFTLEFYRTILTNKGVWLFHMLRSLMYDFEADSEARFQRFLRELLLLVNNRPFDNHDVIRLAEKHYGEPLDWFFRTWLYGAQMPAFDVRWAAVQRDGAWYVPVDVTVSRAAADYRMPVVCRVTAADGQNVFARQTIAGPFTSFELGPFPEAPREFVFNEFFSVLGRQTVNKR